MITVVTQACDVEQWNFKHRPTILSSFAAFVDDVVVPNFAFGEIEQFHQP